MIDRLVALLPLWLRLELGAVWCAWLILRPR